MIIIIFKNYQEPLYNTIFRCSDGDGFWWRGGGSPQILKGDTPQFAINFSGTKYLLELRNMLNCVTFWRLNVSYCIRARKTGQILSCMTIAWTKVTFYCRSPVISMTSLILLITALEAIFHLGDYCTHVYVRLDNCSGVGSRRQIPRRDFTRGASGYFIPIREK